MAVRLKTAGYRVRVIQLVYGGVEWLDKEIEFYTSYDDEQASEVSIEARYGYFLLNSEKPDIILATHAPLITVLAKNTMGALGCNAKVIAWLHSQIEDCAQHGAGGMECLAYADGFFTLTNRAARQLKREFPQKYVTVVNNPIDLADAKVIDQWHKESRKLFFIGRIELGKGLDVVIKALGMTKQSWHLVVMGDGGEMVRCKELAERMNVLDDIMWMGWQAKPWQNYEDVTALVVASDVEGFCLVAADAMARGIPVISTPVDGIVEYLILGVNGYLYEKGSSDGLAEVLDAITDGRLPDIDPQKCAETVQKFEKGRVLDNFVDRIEEILKLEE